MEELRFIDGDSHVLEPEAIWTDYLEKKYQPLVKGLDADIEVTVTNGSNSPGVVQGWIDYNGDGDWNDAGEQVVIDQTVPEGTSTLTIAVPEAAEVGLTYARFRYGYERGIGPAGEALAGEVEDYKILILEYIPNQPPVGCLFS